MTEPHIAQLPWTLENAHWCFLVRFSSDTVPKPSRALCWWWRAIAMNGATWESDELFASRDLCENDAATHGYVHARRQNAGAALT